MGMNNVALEVTSLKKRFVFPAEEIQVLKGVDLTVGTNRWVTLTGRSGSGKTTLLRLLGTLDKPDEGEIKCFGRSTIDMNSREKAKLRRLRVGFIFQSYQLFYELDALENVMLPGRLGNKDLKSIADRAEYLLKEMGLESRLGHRPTELSGGEQQRVAVARALMNDPDIILADEPTGNLDEKNSADIMEILRKLRDEEDKTIVMVTHDQTLTKFADDVYELKNGILC